MSGESIQNGINQPKKPSIKTLAEFPFFQRVWKPPGLLHILLLKQNLSCCLFFTSAQPWVIISCPRHEPRWEVLSQIHLKPWPIHPNAACSPPLMGLPNEILGKDLFQLCYLRFFINWRCQGLNLRPHTDNGYTSFIPVHDLLPNEVSGVNLDPHWSGLNDWSTS